MHALAQNRLGFAAFGRVLDEIGKIGLHEKTLKSFSHRGHREHRANPHGFPLLSVNSAPSVAHVLTFKALDTSGPG
jgi:hypothetical protein